MVKAFSDGWCNTSQSIKWPLSSCWHNNALEREMVRAGGKDTTFERRKSPNTLYFRTLYLMVIILSSWMRSLSGLTQNMKGDFRTHLHQHLGLKMIYFFSERYLSFLTKLPAVESCHGLWGCASKKVNWGSAMCLSVHVQACACKHSRVSAQHLPQGEQKYISSLFWWGHIQTSVVTLATAHSIATTLIWKPLLCHFLLLVQDKTTHSQPHSSPDERGPAYLPEFLLEELFEVVFWWWRWWKVYNCHVNPVLE